MTLPAIVSTVPAFVTDFGGPYVSKSGMAKALAAKGCYVTILTTDIASIDGRRVAPEEHRDQVRQWQQWGVRLVRMPYSVHYRWATASLYAPSAVWQALRRGQRERGAVVSHIAGYREGLGSTASLVAQTLRVPVVWEPMGMARAAGRSLIKKQIVDQSLGRLTLRRAQRIITTSPVERDELLALGVEAERLYVRANGLEELPAWLQQGDPTTWRAQARQRLGLDPDERIVLYLGRITERKGLALIADAMRSAPGRFFLVGPDEQDGTWPRVQAALGDRAVMPGAVQGDAKWDWVAAADIFALAPTHGENFAMSALEAAAVGTPLVLSAAVGFGSMMPAGTGHIVPLDVHQWSEALAAPAPKVALSDVRALRHDFSWSGIVDRQLEVYQSVLSGQGS